jgi:hypothetical protein
MRNFVLSILAMFAISTAMAQAGHPACAWRETKGAFPDAFIVCYCEPEGSTCNFTPIHERLKNALLPGKVKMYQEGYDILIIYDFPDDDCTSQPRTKKPVHKENHQ